MERGREGRERGRERERERETEKERGVNMYALVYDKTHSLSGAPVFVTIPE